MANKLAVVRRVGSFLMGAFLAILALGVGLEEPMQEFWRIAVGGASILFVSASLWKEPPPGPFRRGIPPA